MLQKSNTSCHDQIKPLRNKFIDIYQSGKIYNDISKTMELLTIMRAIIQIIEKSWHSVKPSHEWLAYQNYTKSA